MSIPENTAVLGKEVPLNQIDKELRLLWEADEASTNASLMNFAIYAEDSAALARNSKIVSEITREHACRAILIGIDKDQPEQETKAWVTAHCNLSNGQKSVCCEQLAFHLTGKVRGRMRHTVFSHLNSDLPLVFWWQGELSFIFDEPFYSILDRLVIDSVDWVNTSEGYSKLSQVLKTGLVIQDLAWTRTFHYRLGIAALFDDLTAQDNFKAIEKVKIVHQPVQKVTALLMLAWLSEQAGWSLVDTDLDTYTLKAGSRKIAAQLVEAADAAPLSLVEIQAPKMTLSVHREKDSKYLVQRLIANEHKIERMAPADSDSISELVTDQLSRGGKNSLFRKILPTFLELLG